MWCPALIIHPWLNRAQIYWHRLQSQDLITGHIHGNDWGLKSYLVKQSLCHLLVVGQQSLCNNYYFCNQATCCNHEQLSSGRRCEERSIFERIGHMHSLDSVSGLQGQKPSLIDLLFFFFFIPFIFFIQHAALFHFEAAVKSVSSWDGTSRSFISTGLPEEMVTDFFFLLDSISKVRQALLGCAADQLKHCYVLPAQLRCRWRHSSKTLYVSGACSKIHSLLFISPGVPAGRSWRWRI